MSVLKQHTEAGFQPARGRIKAMAGMESFDLNQSLCRTFHCA